MSINSLSSLLVDTKNIEKSMTVKVSMLPQIKFAPDKALHIIQIYQVHEVRRKKTRCNSLSHHYTTIRLDSGEEDEFRWLEL